MRTTQAPLVASSQQELEELRELQFRAGTLSSVEPRKLVLIGFEIAAFGLATGEDAGIMIVHALIIVLGFILFAVYAARHRQDIRVRGSEES